MLCVSNRIWHTITGFHYHSGFEQWAEGCTLSQQARGPQKEGMEGTKPAHRKQPKVEEVHQQLFVLGARGKTHGSEALRSPHSEGRARHWQPLLQ